MQDTNALNETIGRLRINESKLSSLRERLLVTDSNMIDEFRALSQEIKTINSDVKKLRLEIQKLKELFQDLIKNTENFASAQDVLVLEKYIKMWNPLNFTTDKEVRKIIKEEND